jgi:Excreted virulence factor EspC, type VII ESX diderm
MDADGITVATEALRTEAQALDATAYRLAHGLHAVPGLTVPDPAWAVAAALVALEAAVHAYLGAVGGRSARLSAALRTAATDYEAADDRAFRRFVGPR